MKKEAIKLKKGDLLVSQPFMSDGNFRYSVVFMVEYNDEGALGFILNKKTDYKIGDLLDDFPDFDASVYFGGPVATNTIHYIHSKGDILEGSFEVVKGIFWGGDFDKLKLLISNGVISNDDIQFYVGYSGWSPGQLEDELVHGTWIIAPSDKNYIFKYNQKDLWNRVLESKGDNFDIISQIPKTFSPN